MSQCKDCRPADYEQLTCISILKSHSTEGRKQVIVVLVIGRWTKIVLVVLLYMSTSSRRE